MAIAVFNIKSVVGVDLKISVDGFLSTPESYLFNVRSSGRAMRQISLVER